MQQIIDYVTSHWAIFLTMCATLTSIVYMALDARYARKTVIKTGLDHLDDKLGGLEGRVDKVEQELQHLPSAKDVVELQVAIKQMNGETSALRASVKGLSRLVDILVEKEVKNGDR